MRSATGHGNPQILFTPRVLTASVTATASSEGTTPPVRSVDGGARSAAGAGLPGTPELLERRLASTQAWLEQRAKTDYSIQLMGVDNSAQLQRQFGLIGSYIDVSEVYVYRTVAKRRPSLTLLYGSFEDRMTAQETLAKLPAGLKAFKPILRTVQGIRAEIAQAARIENDERIAARDHATPTKTE